LDRRLGGPQSWSGRGGEEKNYQPLPGFEPPIIQSVAQRYTTELFRLLKEPAANTFIKITPAYHTESGDVLFCAITTTGVTRGLFTMFHIGGNGFLYESSTITLPLLTFRK
jgi:hypothetical protein